MMGIPHQIRHAIWWSIAHQGGIPERVPDAEYDRIFAGLETISRANPTLRGRQPPPTYFDHLSDFLRKECAKVAARYPRPKPYAKKRAVGR